MFKKELLRDELVPATQELIELAKTYKWCVSSKIINVYNQEILVLYLYYHIDLLNDDIMPRYRMFFNKEEYITQDLKSNKVKWLTGTFAHYTGTFYYQCYGWVGGEKKVIFDFDAKTAIYNFFSSNEDSFIAINNHQQKILNKNLEISYKKITDPIDEKMKEVPELPEDFNTWVENDVLLDSRYIYYQYANKANLQGYCTHCKQDVMLYKPRHNHILNCPNCNSKVQLKSIGKSTQVSDEANSAIIQTVKNGLLVRYFHISKRYYKKYKMPDLFISENFRIFYDNNMYATYFFYGNFKNKYTRWQNSGSSTYNRECVLYPYGLKEILNNTFLKYSALDIISSYQKNFGFNIYEYIKHIIVDRTYIEKLVKVGLINLVKDMLNIYSYPNSVKALNINGKTINQILKIENDDVKILINANVGTSALGLFRDVRKQNKRITAEQLSEIQNNYDCYTFEKLMKYASIGKLLKYLRTQSAKEKEQVYIDYLESCKKLKYDLKNTFVLFPRNLVMAHDLNVDILNEINTKKQCAVVNSKYSKIEKMCNLLNKKYGFEDSKFLIVAPKNAGEIIREGQALRHCVGTSGYIERMVWGNTIILFLRKKECPDKSFYTLEIIGNEVRQCHSFKNEDKDKNTISSFIQKYKNKVLKKIKDNERVKVAI